VVGIGNLIVSSTNEPEVGGEAVKMNVVGLKSFFGKSP
jgi:hypothetical protein